MTILTPLFLASALLAPAPASSAVASAAVTPVPAAVPEVQVPKNDGWVTDLAGLLSPDEERALEARMESYRQGSGHEMALLTVPDLGGQPIERYALEVGRAWGIGRKEKNDGALLLVSKGDRKVRIEVGRGLEGTLTDSISGRIIRDVITPSFRAGKFGEGLVLGVEAMHEAAGGDYSSLPEPRKRSTSTGASILRALMSLAFMFFFLMVIGRNTRGRGGRGGMGGLAGPLILGSMLGGAGRHRGGGFGGFSGGGGGFGGFGGGGGFSGGGASGGW